MRIYTPKVYTMLAALLLVVAVTAHAAPNDGPGACWKGKPPVHHKQPPPRVTPAPPLWRQLAGALEVTGGLRWDREVACPTCSAPAPACDRHEDRHEMRDPPFVGLALPLELHRSLELRLAGDLDLDGPNRGRVGSARAELAWKPWKGRQ